MSVQRYPGQGVRLGRREIPSSRAVIKEKTLLEDVFFILLMKEVRMDRNDGRMSTDANE